MKKILSLTLIAALLLPSCDFLKEDQDSYESPTTFYRTNVQCQSAANGCYAPLHAIFVPIGFFFAVQQTHKLKPEAYRMTDAFAGDDVAVGDEALVRKLGAVEILLEAGIAGRFISF